MLMYRYSSLEKVSIKHQGKNTKGRAVKTAFDGQAESLLFKRVVVTRSAK